MADRQRYVEGIREVVCTKENLEYMSKLAVEESGMGAYEYKVIKNRLAAVKSPGVEDLTTEALSGDDGLTLVEYCPLLQQTLQKQLSVTPSQCLLVETL